MEKKSAAFATISRFSGCHVCYRNCQVAAGKKFGTIEGALGVRTDLKHTELSDIYDMGMVPIVNEWGKVFAFSDKSLFNGSDVLYQTYSVVSNF